jgi:hypothetical protein
VVTSRGEPGRTGGCARSGARRSVPPLVRKRGSVAGRRRREGARNTRNTGLAVRRPGGDRLRPWRVCAGGAGCGPSVEWCRTRVSAPGPPPSPLRPAPLHRSRPPRGGGRVAVRDRQRARYRPTPPGPPRRRARGHGGGREGDPREPGYVPTSGGVPRPEGPHDRGRTAAGAAGGRPRRPRTDPQGRRRPARSLPHRRPPGRGTRKGPGGTARAPVKNRASAAEPPGPGRGRRSRRDGRPGHRVPAERSR